MITINRFGYERAEDGLWEVVDRATKHRDCEGCTGVSVASVRTRKQARDTAIELNSVCGLVRGLASLR